MLARLGLSSTAELFSEIPERYRDPAIEIPPALAERELVELMRARAAENAADRAHPSFLGAGAYRRSVPSIAGSVVQRGEFATAYTPYQPEISQGTLQAAFEFQSVVCELTGMEVSNTGLYDAGSATAEAVLMAARITRRRSVAVLEPLHPGTLDVLRTYAYAADLDIEVLGAPPDPADPGPAIRGALDERHACLVVQQPDFLGGIVDLELLSRAAHESGALVVAACDPLALGLLRAPGDAGVDVVTGEGRDLAGPVGFGGPSLGLFAARRDHMRQLPGRIVGRTRELHGPRRADGEEEEPRTGYVLTLQAREQFIRRERATSNFSTGQQLIALAFTVALETLGPRGLGESAELCYQRAHRAAARIDELEGYAARGRGSWWFQEFLVRGPLPPAELLRRLKERGITGGLDVSGRPEPEAREAILVCVTEATPAGDVDALIEALASVAAEAGASP
ncbi:MAG: aminomethyl-transferring glycine dehydrogenase subunit GcvPA [Chloroflexi bacterium]|nr:aminomethyl-transferring glycine dehydrogenase subunit GcvPA [Chloroflexota bacterium]